MHKVRITGAHFTPALKPTIDRVEMLTDARLPSAHEAQRTGHINGGDINYPGWSSQYDEWLASHGIRELTDPDKGTVASGNPSRLGISFRLPFRAVPATIWRRIPL